MVFVRNSAGNDVGSLSTTPAVLSGLSSVNYILPAMLPTGQYTIEVNYPGSGLGSGPGGFGSGNFAASTGSGSFTVTKADASVNVSFANSVAYSSSAQSVILAATVTGSSNGSPVSGGSVTFTVRNSTNAIVGSPIASPVVSSGSSGGQATVSYPFPASAPAGSYSVEAAYSGTENFNASTGSGSVLINGQTTTITVTPLNLNYSAATQVVSLSAAVSASDGTVADGTVFFSISDAFGSNINPSASVSGNVSAGVATASYTIPAGLSPRTYYINAYYSGSNNFGPSSGVSPLVMNGASVTVTPLAVTTNFTRATQTLTFSANLAGGSTINTGTVNFAAVFNGSSVNVSGPVVNGRADAAFTLPAGTPAASYVYTAAYSGGGAFAPGSGSGTVLVNPANTTTTPATASIPFSASATVVNLTTTLTSPSGAVSAGTVTFSLRDGNNNVIGNAQSSATAPVDAGFASTAWVVPANQAVGSYTIAVTYNGTPNLNTSTGNSALTISATNTVLTVPAASRSFAVAASPITLVASVSSSAGVVNGGTVTFTITNGSNAVVGAAVVSPAVANGTVAVSYPLPASLAGSVYNVTAAYSGFGSFAAANAVSTFTVNPANTTSTTPALTAVYSPSNQTINLSATTTSPAGSVNGGSVVFNFRDSSNNLVFASPVAGSGPSNGASTASFNLPGGTLPGAYTMQAVYSGNANFGGSIGNSTLTINGLSTLTSLTAPSSLPFNAASQLLTFSATVTSSSPVNGGAVTFTLRNSANTIIGAVTGSGPVVNGSAAVNFALPAATPPGNYTLQANYLGGAVFGPSNANQTLVVVGGATTTTLSAPLSPLTLGSGVTLTAAVAPVGVTGRVTFYDGAIILGSATVSSGTATWSTRLLPAGNRNLRAVYSGDAVYSTSTSATLARVVRAGSAGALAKPANSPFSTDDGLNASAAGDLNGDGFTDLATVSMRGLRILFGNGSGGVSSSIGPLNAGGYLDSVAVGDFNADGRLDVAVSGFGSSSTSNNLTVFRNDGGNTFVPLTFAAGNGPAGVAFGDFNGDGLPDIVAANRYSNTLTLLRNNGAGSFVPFSASPGVGTEPTSLVVSDFNNDNRADNTITVLLGAGDGSFTSSVLAAGSTPGALVAADFDGNGSTDLAVANNSSGNISLFLNAGSASFAAASNTATLARPRALAAGDFNGDGLLDLGYSSVGGITTLITTVNGSGAVSFSLRESTPASSNVSSLVAFEFNTDGLSDLVYTTNDLFAGSGIDVLLGGRAATTTNVSAANTSVSATPRSLTLTANVASTSGTVNGGAFTFTVRNSSNMVIGSPVTSGPITAGTASALFTVPASQDAGNYTVSAVFSGTDTFATSTGSNTLLITAPATFVITSNPVGLTIVVDGAPVITPATFTNWGAPGTPHTLVAATNPGATGTQYVFASWSQGGAASQTINTPGSGTTYTANFTTQHQFTGNVSGPGSLAPASGWVNAGTVLSVTATPNASATFLGFAGDLSGTTNPQALTMNAPRTVTASFVPGIPALSVVVQSKGNGTRTNERIWTLRFSNTGTAPASNLRILSASITYPPGAGAGPVTISTPLPLAVGELANGSSTTVPLGLIFPVTSPATRINLSLTVTPDGGTTTQVLTTNNQFR